MKIFYPLFIILTQTLLVVGIIAMNIQEIVHDQMTSIVKYHAQYNSCNSL